MKEKELRSWVCSCIKKRRYSSYDFAKEKIKEIQKIRNVKLRVYFCKKCLGYHLTSK